MAQKNKVKELVGRGLNSYHTKALQQIHRIEKKNKEQNHKISILSNELDNDYLTKTEEGSVISLEHSKEGMVYLDELQGNTLVNYCTDGSKEMTLNGDIDVEGTFVTTTEGVDNGKVDVICEGNTLVNLVNRYNYHANIYSHVCFFKNGMLKANTKYSAIITNPSNEVMRLYWNEGIFNYVEIDVPANSTKVFTHTTKTEMNIDVDSTLFKNAKTHTQAIQFKVIFLEGDWTNKELPTSYFEGMKSVGQDDTNGHKIEILSQNKNLVSELEVGGLNSTSGAENENNGVFTIRNKGYIKVEPNTTYTLSIEDNNTFEGMVYHIYDKDKKHLQYNPSSKFTLTTPNNASYLRFRSFNADANNVNTNLKIQLEKGNIRTSYVPHSINKKEILINKPLRGLPNGVKDRVVKINNKWFIERNCGYVTVDGTEDGWQNSATYEYGVFRLHLPSLNHKYIEIGDRNEQGALCNTLRVYWWWTAHNSFETVPDNSIYYSTYNNSNALCIVKKNLRTVDELKQWLKSNKTEFIYQLATPIYEPLEVEPTLNTYNDITHISNNSIIPCNMKIKNTGYNAIIKPSTLYTVALDTNKSGTVGIDLGGMKTVTTNNVVTITTPAILSDDSLRLFGKGIKGSKVRLLEGDKTNWIPSFFEGMKSSFEDKVQDDGSYKMEILSNNKNLINAPNMSCTSPSSGGWWNLEGNNNSMYNNIDKKTNLYFYAEKGKRYIISFDSKNLALTQRLKYQQQEMILPSSTISNENGRYKLLVIGDGLFSTFRFRAKIEDGSTPMEITNFMIIEENLYSNEFIKNKSNKIQFSSIEPLRGVGDVKDRFVFKEDGKLMIERNCGHYIFNENTPWIGTDYKNKGHWIRVNDNQIPNYKPNLKPTLSIPSVTDFSCWNNNDNELEVFWDWTGTHMYIFLHSAKTKWNVKTNYNGSAISDYMKNNPIEMVYELLEPTYEEIPYELQKIILEGYENGTLFFDTNIPPTATVKYAGETPIVKATKLNKTEVLNNTEDINDNIIPYLMDMDYRVVMLQLATEELEGGVSMARLFGGTYEMIKRDILSKRLTREEYGYRLADYFNAGKLTEEQVRELEELR